jgi:predicted acylesterase/phospholipase RssA
VVRLSLEPSRNRLIWGVDFVGLAGTSAGSIVAAFLGAGASPDQLLEMLAKLKFTDLLVEPEQLNVGPPPMRMKVAGFVGNLLGFEQAGDLVRRHGMHSSRKLEEWVNEELRNLLPDSPSDRVKFRDLVKPTWIVAADIFDRDVKVWSTDETPLEEVAHAVRCSCSIPVFFQPVDNVHGRDAHGEASRA